MKCDLCKTALAHEPHIDRVKAVQDVAGQLCGCEFTPANNLSPGIVQDDEMLFIIVRDPKDIQSGHLSPHVGVQVDCGGWSCLRENATDAEFLKTFAELGVVTGGAQTFYGIFSVRANDVRYKFCDRFMCVYDTALDGKPHHADIMAPNKLSNSRNKKRVKLLLDRIGTSLVLAADFREGRFARFARTLE
jgi:hypothetical protein